MRRTNFCHSHVYVRVPAPRRFPATSGRFRVSRSWGKSCLFLRQCNSLQRVARVSLETVIVAGVVFPSRCVQTEPLTSLSPPPRFPRRSRVHELHEGRLDRFRHVRVNERAEK